MLAILVGGLAAGVLDIVYAFVWAGMHDTGPLRVLQSVASGLLGASAYRGGVAAAVLGLVLHLAITIVAAGVYWRAASLSPAMRRRWLVCGALFGVLVYLFMNFVVLPLSAVPFTIRYTPAVLVRGFVSHALLVGIPIAAALERLRFARAPVVVAA